MSCIDRPLRPTLAAALGQAENCLLWSIRAWVVGHCRNLDVSDRIAAVCACLGAPCAAGYLDEFMQVLSRSAARTLEINCVCHPEVSLDERLLLDVLARQQEDAAEEAFDLLTLMLSEQGAIAASARAQRLALALAAGGTLLQPCPSPALRAWQPDHAEISPTIH